MSRYLAMAFILFSGTTVAQNFNLFVLKTIGYEDGHVICYTSLSDVLPIYETEDSSLIAPNYLGKATIENENLHELAPVYRKRALSRLHFKETDSIYLFNLYLDTVLVKPLSTTPLVAFLNVYGTDIPIPEYDYVIGFKWSQAELDLFGYTKTLVAVSASNPFVTGKAKAIQWKPASNQMFPEVASPKQDWDWLKYVDSTAIFTYESKTFNYFLKSYYFIARHLLISEKESGNIIFNQVYLDRESTSLNPLNYVEDTYGEVPEQWTGRILKNYPSVVMGFLSHSFGCERIDFIQKSTPSIRVQCDNRH